MFRPSKVIRTRESGNFKLVASGIRKILARGIRTRAEGMRNPAYDWNPESTEKESETQHLESVLNPECGIRNPSLVPRPVRAIIRGGLEPTLIGYVISQITEDDWEKAARIQDCPGLPYITFCHLHFLSYFPKRQRENRGPTIKKYIPFSKVLDAVDISIPRENICPEQGNDAEKLVG